MKHKELIYELTISGWHFKEGTTGDVNWTRVFMEYHGVTYGRVSLYCGKVANVKWYNKPSSTRGLGFCNKLAEKLRVEEHMEERARIEALKQAALAIEFDEIPLTFWQKLRNLFQ